MEKMPKIRHHARVIRFGGWSMILAGFFYPLITLNAQIPDSSWQHTLEKLYTNNLSTTLFWALATFVPMLLLFGGIGAFEALKDKSPYKMKIALASIIISSFSLVLGLIKWSGVLLTLAHFYNRSSEDDKSVYGEVYQLVDNSFGVYVGQYLAEATLFIFVLLVSVSCFRSRRMPNWQAVLGLVTGVFGIVGLFRDVSEPAAAFQQVYLSLSLVPIWLITLGIGLLMYKNRQS